MPAGELKLFVSHSNVDNVFTRRLVEDLRRHGANVWVDFDDIDTGDFAATINQGMDNCDWMVAVLTPASLKSKWVIMEVNAAMNMKADGFLKGVVPIVAEPFQTAELPPIWRTLQRYDATKDYDRAFAGLCKALGIKALKPQNEPAQLTVNATPSGTRVLIDGIEAHGQMTISMGTAAVKTVVVEVSKYGYLPKRLNLELTPGENRVTELVLDEKPITLEADPDPIDRRWLAVGAVVVLGLTVYALRQLSNADDSGGNNANRTSQSKSNNVQSANHTPSNERWAKGWTVDPPLTGHTEYVFAVAISPDCVTLASGSWDKSVRLWDIRTRKALGEPLIGHSGRVASVAFSPDGNTLATIGREIFVSASDGTLIQSFDNTIRLWNVRTGLASGVPITGAKSYNSVAFSSDGVTLATGNTDNTIGLWNVRTRKPLGEPLLGHTGNVLSVAFSPDGTTIASGSADKTLRLWDVRTGKSLGEPLTGHSDGVRSVSFSPDGNTVASGSWDKTVRLWDVRSRKPLGEPLTGHTGDVLSVVFSADGTMLASGSSDKTVRLWDLRRRKPIGKPLTDNTSSVLSVAFSIDGNTIAAGSGTSVYLWHPKE